MNKIAWILMVVCVAGALAAPKEKEIITKKKLLAKAKSETDSIDFTEGKPLEGLLVMDKLEVTLEDSKDPTSDSKTETVSEDSAEEETAVVEVVATPTAVDKPRPSFMTRAKMLVRKLLEIFGFIAKRREAKMMGDANRLDDMEPPYTKEVKIAFGAMLGKQECLKKTACGAGALLRNIRGKELLIVLLEKFAPLSWSEPVNQIRSAAI